MLPRDAMTILAVMKKSIATADGRIENLEEKINQILPGYDYYILFSEKFKVILSRMS